MPVIVPKDRYEEVIKIATAAQARYVELTGDNAFALSKSGSATTAFLDVRTKRTACSPIDEGGDVPPGTYLVALDEHGMGSWVFEISEEDYDLAPMPGYVNVPAGGLRFVRRPNGERITWDDLLIWLAVGEAMDDGDEERVRHIREVAYGSTGGEADVPVVPLAQYPKSGIIQNHDMAVHALRDGLVAIAMGDSSFDLAPRGGRSHERYRLTASEDACAELFRVKGANSEQVAGILDTVYTLKKDPRAADFVHEGRVWFTVNKIAEEYLRTTGGTVTANRSRKLSSLVDAALRAASSAQLVSTSPDGRTTNVVYALDAVRLETIRYHGQTYHGVWGVSVSSETLSEYGEGKGHAYRYDLPDRRAPFTPDTAWIHTYLSDAMNEARSRLYSTSKAGEPSARGGTKKFTITRAWQGSENAIFELASPLSVLNSRQRDRLVTAFEDELTEIVRQEARGERRSGAPLYVRAWSEREAGRGRGKGAYRNLKIEATTTFRTVRDGRDGRGKVDLHGGKENAAPARGSR